MQRPETANREFKIDFQTLRSEKPVVTRFLSDEAISGWIPFVGPAIMAVASGQAAKFDRDPVVMAMVSSWSAPRIRWNGRAESPRERQLPCSINFQFGALGGRPPNWSGSVLEWSNFRKVDLRNADLRRANLRFADLRSARLDGTNLEDADLSGADLRGAILTDAILSCGQRCALCRSEGVRSDWLPAPVRRSGSSGCMLPPACEFEQVDRLEKVIDWSHGLRFCYSLPPRLDALIDADFARTTLRSDCESSSLILPEVASRVPTIGFYLAGPAILLCLFGYFHVNLHNIWVTLATLPERLPNGTESSSLAGPWLLINGVGIPQPAASGQVVVMERKRSSARRDCLVRCSRGAFFLLVELSTET